MSEDYIWSYITKDIWFDVIKRLFSNDSRKKKYTQHKQQFRSGEQNKVTLSPIPCLRVTCKTLLRLVDQSEYWNPLVGPCSFVELYKGRSKLGWDIFKQVRILPEIRHDVPIPFVIPEGITNLELYNINPYNYDESDVYTDRVTIPTNLTKLVLTDSFPLPDHNDLVEMTTLKTLSINTIWNEDLSADFYNEPIKAPTSLTELSLCNTGYVDSFMPDFPNLVKLVLVHNVNIHTDENPSMFDKLCKLETLIFHYGKDPDKYGMRPTLYTRKEWVETLPRSLTSIDLSQIVITDKDGSEPVKLPPKLKHFGLKNYPNEETNASGNGHVWCNGPTLTLLDGIPDTLTSLDLTGGCVYFITDTSISAVLSRNRNIVKIVLESCRGIEGLFLSRLPFTVRHLNLKGSGLKPDGLQWLSPSIPLVYLDIGDTEIEIDSLLSLLLSQRSKLSYLDISDCHRLSLSIVKSLFDIGLFQNTVFSHNSKDTTIGGWTFLRKGTAVSEHVKFVLDNGLFDSHESVYMDLCDIAAYDVTEDGDIAIKLIRDHLQRTGFDKGETNQYLHMETCDKPKLPCILMYALDKGFRRSSVEDSLNRIKFLIDTFDIKVTEQHQLGFGTGKPIGGTKYKAIGSFLKSEAKQTQNATHKRKRGKVGKKRSKAQKETKRKKECSEGRSLTK